MSRLELVVAEVQDPAAKENFDRLQRASDEDVFGRFLGRHLALTLSKNLTYTYPHNLGFAPLDVIQTRLVKPAAATLTWNYDSFDRTNISLTVAGLAAGESVEVRAFFGSYVEE